MRSSLRATNNYAQTRVPYGAPLAPSTPVGVPEGEAVGTSQASEYADPKAKPTEGSEAAPRRSRLVCLFWHAPEVEPRGYRRREVKLESNNVFVFSIQKNILLFQFSPSELPRSLDLALPYY